MTIPRRIYRSIAIWLCALVGVLLLFEVLPIHLDLMVQDRFYDASTGRWLIEKDQQVWRGIFYYGMKYAVILVGLIALVSTVLPAKWLARIPLPHGRRRRAAAAVFLCITIIPSFVGFLKDTTDVYFPSKIERYGGQMPYVRLFEKFPEEVDRSKPGRGFPAGHASGGFALFSLVYWVSAGNRRKVWWFAFIYGSLMAAYQTVNGAHYLSHTLVTICIAQIFVLLAGLAFKLDPFPGFNFPPAASAGQAGAGAGCPAGR